MARIVKRKKKKYKVTLLGWSLFFFFISVILWLWSSLYINQRNNALTMKIQKLQGEIAVLRTENSTLNGQIEGLKSPERVYQIATASGMTIKKP